MSVVAEETMMGKTGCEMDVCVAASIDHEGCGRDVDRIGAEEMKQIGKEQDIIDGTQDRDNSFTWL